MKSDPIPTQAGSVLSDPKLSIEVRCEGGPFDGQVLIVSLDLPQMPGEFINYRRRLHEDGTPYVDSTLRPVYRWGLEEA